MPSVLYPLPQQPLEHFPATPAASPIDLAWAAGLFEGEGTAVVQQFRTRPDRRPRLLLAMAQIHPGVLHRFARIVGGNVTGPYVQRGNALPQWRWQATGGKGEAIADLLLPYLGAVKSEQIRAALARLG